MFRHAWSVGLFVMAIGCDRHGARTEPAPRVVDAAVSASAPRAREPSMERAMDRARVPGLALATVRGGAIRDEAYGLADVARAVAASRETLFETASISKLVTAAAVMQLVEQGKLSLDEDVSRALPFPVRNPAFPEVPITVRMLLAHVSSIIDDPGVLRQSVSRGGPSVGLADFLRASLTNKDRAKSFLDVAPRTTHRYSNVAVSLAALLVERRSGESFDAYSRGHVLAPLGIVHARWRLADLDPARIALPHRWTGERYEATGHVEHALYPVVDLRATAGEIAALLATFANGGARGEVRILRRESMELLLKPAAPALEPSQGLIFQRAELDGRALWGHEGEDEGATTMAFFDPQTGNGAVVLANGDAFASGSEERAAAMRDVLRDALR